MNPAAECRRSYSSLWGSRLMPLFDAFAVLPWRSGLLCSISRAVVNCPWRSQGLPDIVFGRPRQACGSGRACGAYVDRGPVAGRNIRRGGSLAAYLLLPARWAVTGMALSYGLAYVIGVGVAWKRLRSRLGGDLDGRRVVRSYARLIGAALPASLVAGSVAARLMTAMHPRPLPHSRHSPRERPR